MTTRVNLSQALEGFYLAKLAEGCSQNTIDLYSWVLGILVELVGDKPLDTVTLADLRQLMLYGRDKEYKPNTLDKFWIAVRSFYTWAEDELDIQRVDLNLKRPHVTTEKIKPFTQDEINRLLTACEYTKQAESKKRRTWKMKRPTANRDRAMILLLLDTGIRVSECTRLRMIDVNLKAGTVDVQPHGSGQKTTARRVYIGTATRQALWRYHTEIESDSYVFLTSQNRGMTRFTIKNLLTRLGDRASVANVHAHRFRHTFAIQYLRNGGDVYTLQRLLGHSTLDMVKRYLAIADVDAAAAHRLASPVDRWNL